MRNLSQARDLAWASTVSTGSTAAQFSTIFCLFFREGSVGTSRASQHPPLEHRLIPLLAERFRFSLVFFSCAKYHTRSQLSSAAQRSAVPCCMLCCTSAFAHARCHLKYQNNHSRAQLSSAWIISPAQLSSAPQR